MNSKQENQIDYLITLLENDSTRIYNSLVRQLKQAYKNKNIDEIKRLISNFGIKQEKLLDETRNTAIEILILAKSGQILEIKRIKDVDINITKKDLIDSLNQTRKFIKANGDSELMNFEKILKKNGMQTKEILKLTEKSLLEGLKKGSSLDEITDIFKKNIIDASKLKDKGLINYDFKRVVRTELLRAKSIAQERVFESAKDYGIKKKWITSQDERVRKSHRSMHGKLIGADGYFTFPSGVKTKAPRLSGVASEDIMCRCSLIAIK